MVDGGSDGEVDDLPDNNDAIKEAIERGPSYTDFIAHSQIAIKDFTTDVTEADNRMEQFRDWAVETMQLVQKFDEELIAYYHEFKAQVENLSKVEFSLHINLEVFRKMQEHFADRSQIKDYNFSNAYKTLQEELTNDQQVLKQRMVKERNKEFRAALKGAGIWEKLMQATKRAQKAANGGEDEEMGDEKGPAQGDEKGDEGEAMDEDEDDDGLEVVNSGKSYKCPLSLKPFEHPMRAPCGHHFEKKNILDMLENGAIDCPMIGCKAKINKPEDLKEDKKMRHKTQQWLRKKKAASQAADLLC